MVSKRRRRPAAFDLAFQHGDLDSKIVAAQERIAQAFRTLQWRAAKERGMSPLQVQILVFLIQHGRRRGRASQIAEELTVTRPTVSDALSALEAKGLVRRAPAAEDGRGVSALLTLEGRAIGRKLARWADEGRAVLAPISVEDRRAILSFLMRWIEALQNAGVVTVARMCITCRFYEDHRCKLIGKPLPAEALRVDCPEHEQRPALAS
jgi:DNA-binding MarR family transcriptional regulator